MTRSLVSAAAIAALALAACGGGSNPPPPPPPPPPPVVVVVTDFQPGSTLIGQPDWTSTPPFTNPCSPSSLQNPAGTVAWDGTSLIVPDTDSHRLLLFSPIPAAESDPASAPDASRAIGQPNLTTCQASATLGFPQATSVSGTQLVVADSSGLVLVWNTIPAASGTLPDVTVGDGTSDCTSTGLSDPRSAIVVGSSLVIADSGHNRVLVYDLADTSAPALVLGQVESADLDRFDLCAANDATGTGYPIAPSASTMSSPTAVWSDGTRLAVADTGNHRILLWNAFPASSGLAADVVIGWPDFTSPAAGAAAAAAANRLNAPQSIAFDGEQLFVADTGNNRVVVFPTIPAANDASASIVLGQGGWMTTVGTPVPAAFANDDDQDGAPDANPTARTLSGPTGVAIVDGLLAVTDTGNGRVVIYRPPAP